MGIQLQGQIASLLKGERAVASLEGVVTPNCNRRERKVWMWGEMAQELINYGQKCSPVPSDRGDSKAIRHVEWRIPTQQSGPKKTTPPMNHGGRINVTEKHKKRRNSLWILGLQKGITKTLIDGQPTGKLELLVKSWHSREGLEEPTSATAPPLEGSQNEKEARNFLLHPQQAKGGCLSEGLPRIQEGTY